MDTKIGKHTEDISGMKSIKIFDWILVIIFIGFCAYSLFYSYALNMLFGGISFSEKTLYKDAIKHNDFLICDSIGSPYRESCREELAIKNKDFSICPKESPSTGRYNHAECFGRVALLNKDFSICNKFGDDCWYIVATGSGQVDLCEKVNSALEKEECVRVFSSRNDFLYCDKISFKEGRDICNLDTIQQSLDESRCDTISDIYNRNICYYELAGYEYRSGICNKIEGSDNIANLMIKNCNNAQKFLLEKQPVK